MSKDSRPPIGDIFKSIVEEEVKFPEESFRNADTVCPEGSKLIGAVAYVKDGTNPPSTHVVSNGETQIDENTPCMIASVGKTITGAIQLKVMEGLEQSTDGELLSQVKGEHKTLMDVPIGEILSRMPLERPELGGKLQDMLQSMSTEACPNPLDVITPRMLTNMRSGIPNWFHMKKEYLDKGELSPFEAMTSDPSLQFTGKEIVDYRCPEGTGLEFAPGTQNQYSNGGFIITGILCEAITGEDFQDLLPIVGCHEATHTKSLDEAVPDNVVKKRVYANTASNPNSEPLEMSSEPMGYSAGGVLISAKALSDWLPQYLSGDLFETDFYKEEARSGFTPIEQDQQQIERGEQQYYGNGVCIQSRQNGLCTAQHVGGMFGTGAIYTQIVDGAPKGAGENFAISEVSNKSFVVIEVGDAYDKMKSIAKEACAKRYPEMEELPVLGKFSPENTRHNDTSLKEQQRIKNLDALDLATTALISPELIEKAKEIGANVSLKPPIESESKGEEKSSWIDRVAKDNPRVGFNKTPSGSREI